VRSQQRADQTRVGRLLHVTSALVLVSAPQPATASQPSIYGFTAVTALWPLPVTFWLHSGTRSEPRCGQV